MHDKSYRVAISAWIENHLLWQEGKHPDQNADYEYYAEYDGDAPSVEGYRPDWGDGEATWWQVYETVSEGTPVSPPFGTQEELIDYLVAHGDFWDQERGHAGWERKAAERFVKEVGWAPSGIVIPGKGFKTGIEALTEGEL